MGFLADADDLRTELLNALSAAAGRLVPGGRETALALLESRGRLVSLRVAHPGTGGTCVVEFSVYPEGLPLTAESCQFRLKLSGREATVFNWTRRGRTLALPATGVAPGDSYPLSMQLPGTDLLIALEARLVSPRSRYPRRLKIYLEPLRSDDRPLVDVAVSGTGA